MYYYFDESYPVESKVITLPDDIMVMPISGKDGLRICHSDSAGKWYAIFDFNSPVETEKGLVSSCVIDSGTWADLADRCFAAYFVYAPFKWGSIYKSRYAPDLIQIIPIWERVETGKYDDEGLPITKEVYKLIHFMPYRTTTWADNVMQYNADTQFDIVPYNNLVDLVRDLELYTGLKF